MSQADDNSVSNPSSNPRFGDVVEVSLQRRRVLQAGFGAAALSFLGAPALSPAGEALARGRPRAPSFVPIEAAFADTVRVPRGYSAQVLYRWGDPTGIAHNMPHLQTVEGVSVNSAEDQGYQAGMDHDGMHYFATEGGNRGLLCINHENVQESYLLAGGLAEAERVQKAKNAHGISVIEVRQSQRGVWEVVRPSRYARRITADTPMHIAGPAAGHDLMRTSGDPAGRTVLGTLNNCADGYTPWGTYLTCEENFNGYFQSGTPGFVASAHMNRYGINASGSGFNWQGVDARFDIALEPNEPNRFGWVVEIDPKKPQEAPVKRTALGRFKHENAAVVLSRDKHVVVYMGDDERNEYIYKFVSTKRLRNEQEDPGQLLDEGTLYVAVFEPGAETLDDKGKGRWMPLAFGLNGLTDENGFTSQAEVLVKTRQAADRVGATMMDRPEWIAVHPKSNDVFIALTNNSRRGASPSSTNAVDGTTTAGSARPPLDDANPRANNAYGHIVRWREKGGDPAALTFEWDVFLFAGDPANALGTKANTQGFSGFEDPAYHIFSAPDGLAFDELGWLWIQTDYGASTSGVQGNMGNCHMMLADVQSGRVGRFLTGPNGCEITGWTMTPDHKSLFVNIQHPGEGGRPSMWPDDATPPRSATIVITKDDGGIIGT